MTSLIKDKISSLDSDILSTAKAGDFVKQSQKLKTQKSLEEMLQKREHAEQNNQRFPATNLEEDALYQAAKEAGDEDIMQSIKNRKLTKTEYRALSEKYKVNQDVVDYDPQYKKSDSKESKEVAKKSLEFESDTFKIDSTDFVEATKENLKDHPEIEKFIDKGVKVKVNATGDVVEYLEDTIIDGKIMCKKGEQIFIDYDKFVDYVAADKQCSRKEVVAKYLMTIDELEEKMKDKPNNSEEYKKFFNQEIKGLLAGCWNPWVDGFCNIGGRSNMWLAGGDNADFYEDGWDRENFDSRDFGFSGRLLKN